MEIHLIKIRLNLYFTKTNILILLVPVFKLYMSVGGIVLRPRYSLYSRPALSADLCCGYILE